MTSLIQRLFVGLHDAAKKRKQAVFTSYASAALCPSRISCNSRAGRVLKGRVRAQKNYAVWPLIYAFWPLIYAVSFFRLSGFLSGRRGWLGLALKNAPGALLSPPPSTARTRGPWTGQTRKTRGG